MTFRILLVTSTALSLSVGAAWADGNVTLLDQLQQGASAGNTALITQDGSNNVVGSAARGDFLQRTDNNSGMNNLDVLQKGDNNRVGSTLNSTQYGRDGTANVADFTQISDDNLVGAVNQRTDRQSGTGGNTMTVVQGSDDGLGTTTGGNEIGNASQRVNDGGSNVLTVDMLGDNNRINRIEQQADGNAGDNTITIEITGNNNGRSNLTGFALAAIPPSTNASKVNNVFKQGKLFGDPDGDNNINLAVSGDDNAFSIMQFGVGNDVGNVTITGSSNDLGILQEGDNNLVTLAVLGGNFNNVGIVQNGTNFSDVDIAGSMNEVSIDQNGTNGTGSDGKGVFLDITGDSNGVGLFGSGDADSVGLTNGTIVQDGSNNLFDGDLTTNFSDFASFQDGSDNTVLVSVSGGDSNQFAVSQVGATNMADLSQTGSSNNAGIIQ